MFSTGDHRPLDRIRVCLGTVTGEEWSWKAMSWEPCLTVSEMWSWVALIRSMIQSALHFRYITLVIICGAELRWTWFKALQDSRRNIGFEIWQSRVTKESYLPLLSAEFYPLQCGDNITYFVGFSICFWHMESINISSNGSTICYSD